jgi:hypothetical protein
MNRKLVIILSFFFMFLNLIPANAKDFKYIEIFDPKQDKVIKVIQSNPQIQDMITNWISNIEGLYKNDPATDDGYAIKISLYPTVKVNCKSLNALVSEVYIIIPENDPPFYLIFEEEDKLLSFPFNGDIDKLSKLLNFKLNSNKSYTPDIYKKRKLQLY